MSFERCGQCTHWINTTTSNHLIFTMHSGTDVLTHYQKAGGCSQWFQDNNCADIKCVTKVTPTKEVVKS